MKTIHLLYQSSAQLKIRTGLLAHQILGQEFAHAVYDGFSGLHPDKLAALAGTIKAGGILFLLLPELDDLASWQDPALSTVQSHGQSIDYSLFNQRFATIIKPLPAFHLSEKVAVLVITPAM
ncbi:DUF1726 domain-containing protein [Pseudoalteromonas sp. B193]